MPWTLGYSRGVELCRKSSMFCNGTLKTEEEIVPEY